jgi:hypothetical protein
LILINKLACLTTISPIIQLSQHNHTCLPRPWSVSIQPDPEFTVVRESWYGLHIVRMKIRQCTTFLQAHVTCLHPRTYLLSWTSIFNNGTIISIFKKQNYQTLDTLSYRTIAIIRWQIRFSNTILWNQCGRVFSLHFIINHNLSFSKSYYKECSIIGSIMWNEVLSESILVMYLIYLRKLKYDRRPAE